jgi:hypothetical protein
VALKQPANTCTCSPPGELAPVTRLDKPMGCGGYVCAHCRRTVVTLVNWKDSDTVHRLKGGQKWRFTVVGGPRWIEVVP